MDLQKLASSSMTDVHTIIQVLSETALQVRAQHYAIQQSYEINQHSIKSIQLHMAAVCNSQELNRMQ